MSAIAIQSSGSGAGTLSIAAPITATNRTLTLPDGTGTFAVNGVSTNIVSGTAVASTSGTSIDFTSIPSWVKRITVMFNGVSTNGTSTVQIQLGYQSPVTSTGYLGTNATQINTGVSVLVANSTSGFVLGVGNTSYDSSASSIRSGQFVFSSFGSNYWTMSGSMSVTGVGLPTCVIAQGGIAVGGTLDRVRITTVNGTDTFDAGSINILYE